MRPMTRLVLGLVVLIGIFAAVALGLPSHVTVTRSVVINAPEPIIFPYLNNLHEQHHIIAGNLFADPILDVLSAHRRVPF